MLCNKCGKKEASYYLEKNINGKVTKLALCPDCARESGEFKFDPFGGMNLLGGLFGFPSISQIPPRDVKRCTLCASTFEEIMKNGKVGCAECYKVFSDELEPTIRRIHGNHRHIGRRPLKFTEAERKSKNEDTSQNNNEQNEIETLKRELGAAVKDENYERAAQLRDKIKELENGNQESAQ